MDLQHIINCLTALHLNTDKKNEASFDIENILIMLLQYKKEQALQLQQTGVSTCFLEDVTDDVFNMVYKQVSCCKIAPITDENYCPKCGKKILK